MAIIKAIEALLNKNSKGLYSGQYCFYAVEVVHFIILFYLRWKAVAPFTNWKLFKSIFVYVYNVGFHDLLRLNGATTMQIFGPFM